jgi:ABC-type multidrug transport system ATPase subunit
MIGEPVVLVLDEPTAHMDLRHRRRVHTILDHLAATTTVVIVTHDVREASAILDKVALLSAGRLQILSSRHRSQRPDRCLIPKLAEDDPRMQEPVLDIGFERAADNEWLGLCVSEVHNEPE